MATHSNILRKYLEIIQSTFNVPQIITERQEEREIKDYYLTNHFGYLLFHNKDGFMHMGISNTERYQKDDLLTHLKIIQSYIEKVKAKQVLELGAGNGSNSLYLAKHNSNVQFSGLDLSKKALKKQPYNYKQILGDYHDLHEYNDNSMDLVFIIEALCHSNRKETVLKEVYKKLRKGGLFIIFDGYTCKNTEKLSKDELIAKKLTEKTMAVDSFDTIKDFEDMVKKSNFTLLERKDFSQQIMPSLRRFEKLALIFYKYPLLARIIKAIFPYGLTKNSIAGLLMPTLIQERIACYYLHVLQKS